MFTNYEDLVCSDCDITFSGRRPADGGVTRCPVCAAAMTEVIIDVGDEIPISVLNEISNAGGE